MISLTVCFLVTAVSCGLVSGSTTIQVEIPESLRKETGYENSNALFGMTPYGGSILQQLYYTEDIMCSGSNEYEGRTFPGRPRSPFILMVDRGRCSFVTKVRRAQHFGAAAVLIADDTCQCDHSNCTSDTGFCENSLPVMGDDGSGGDISIPAVLLFKEDADAIKDALKANQSVRVEMSFSVSLSQDRVEYEFWSRPWDPQSADFLSNFKFVSKALDQKAKFTPHYAIYNGITAGCRTPEGENQCGTLCTNKGRYCSNEPDNGWAVGVHGADVVTESLRRICLWTIYGEDGIGFNWWTYVEEFIMLCHSSEQIDHVSFSDCVEDVYNQTGIDKTKIDECMRDSGGLEDDNSNVLLDAEISLQAQRGIVVVPSFVVNENPVRGRTSSASMFEAICAGYTEAVRPDVCNMCEACANVKECVMEDGICPSRRYLRL